MTAAGFGQLEYVLPRLRGLELRLRGRAQALGISYTMPEYAGYRTRAVVDQLIKWRDDSVRVARDTAAKKPGATAASVKAAGDAAYYRVAPYDSGKHPAGGAFDLRVTKTPAGMTSAAAYKILGAEWKKMGGIWGGDFSAPADIYHFELPESRETLMKELVSWQAQGSTSDKLPAPKTASDFRGAIGGVMFAALLGGLALYFSQGQRT